MRQGILWIGEEHNCLTRLRKLLGALELKLWKTQSFPRGRRRLKQQKGIRAAVLSVSLFGEKVQGLAIELEARFPGLPVVLADDEDVWSMQAESGPRAAKQRLSSWEQQLLRVLQPEGRSESWSELATSEAWGNACARMVTMEDLDAVGDHEGGESWPANEPAKIEPSLEGMIEKAVQERTSQLEIAKREWEQTFDAILEPVMIVGESFRIIRANLAVASIAGVDIRSVVGQHCYRILMGRQEPCRACPMLLSLKEQKRHERELWHKSGERLFHVRSFPLFGEEPRVIHEYRDVTKERALQQRLMQSDKLSSLGMLAGRVAHEINNPLAAILAQTQLLQMELDLPVDELRRSLEDIEKASLRCRKIVLDMLNFSRQAPTDRNTYYDLNNIVLQTLDMFAVLPPKRSPELQFQKAPDLPPLRMDPNKMQSAVLNLLSNAKSAVPEKKGLIQLRTFREEGNVVLSVRDNGAGIPDDLQEKVFMPFFSTKPRELGTGLGLYIAREIVKEHDGRLELQSDEGFGSEFRIYLAEP